MNVSTGILANSSQTYQELRQWLACDFEIEMIVSLPRPVSTNLHGAKSNAIFLRQSKADLSHETMLASVESYAELSLVLEISRRRD